MEEAGGGFDSGYGEIEVVECGAAGSGGVQVGEAQGRIACVITGLSAGLPGNEGDVFQDDNLARLVRGDQCIKPLSDR